MVLNTGEHPGDLVARSVLHAVDRLPLLGPTGAEASTPVYESQARKRNGEDAHTMDGNHRALHAPDGTQAFGLFEVQGDVKTFGKGLRFRELVRNCESTADQGGG